MNDSKTPIVRARIALSQYRRPIWVDPVTIPVNAPQPIPVTHVRTTDRRRRATRAPPHPGCDAVGRIRTGGRDQGPGGGRRSRRRPRAVRLAGGAAAAPRDAHRVSLSPRCGRRRRSGAGRVRQGVSAHRAVPRGAALRCVVHAHPRQRLPRPVEEPEPAAAVDRRAERGLARRAAGRAGRRRASRRASISCSRASGGSR